MSSPTTSDESERLSLLKSPPSYPGSRGAGSHPPRTTGELSQGYSILETSLDFEHLQKQKPNAGAARDDDPPGTSDLSSAVFNLATSIIGAGIMALPATMRVLGLPLGFLLILLMAILSETSLEFVVRFSAALRARTYGDLVSSALRSPARLISQLCIILNNAGILIVYLIIIADVISGSPPHHPGLLPSISRSLTILLTIIFVLTPLCSLRRIDSLRFSSAASVALAVLFVVLVSGVAVVKGIRGELQVPRMLPDMSSWSSALELLTVVPIMTNAFICHFNIQPIYWELRDRSPARMNRAGRISSILCFIIYSATSLSGYLIFGQATAADVLTNFDQDLGIGYSSVIDAVIRGGYVAHLMLVFPVIHFSLRETVDSLVFRGGSGELAESWLRFWGWTGLLLGVVFVGAAFIPNIWIAFQFTGATAGLSLGFIFPALVVLRLSGVGGSASGGKKKRKSEELERCVAWGMLVLAAGSSCLGLITNIYNVAVHHVD